MFNFYTAIIIFGYFLQRHDLKTIGRQCEGGERQLSNKGRATKCVVNKRLQAFSADRIYQELLVLCV